MDMRTERCEFSSFALQRVDRYALKPSKEGALEATESENCRCENGWLYSALGLVGIANSKGNTIQCDFDVKSVLPVSFEMDGKRGQAAVAIDTDGKIWCYRDGADCFLSNAQVAQGNVTICSYPDERGDGGVLIAAENGVFQTNILSESYTISAKATNGGACFFKERLFASSQQGVMYSNAGDFKDFQESAYGGGYIAVGDGHGRVYQLLACEDSILLFKLHSVFRLYASGAADRFRLEKLPYGGEMIAVGSAARCGKYTVFTTCSGDVYRLDGKEFVKIAHNLPSEFCADFIGTASDGQRYFRAGGARTLVMDMDGNSYFSFSVQGLSDYGGSAVGRVNGSIVRFSHIGGFPRGEKGRFFVRDLPLKDDADKVVKRLTIFGEGVVGVTLQSDRKKVKKTVSLTKTGTAIDVDLRGNRFDLSIEFSGRVSIGKMAVEFVRVGGEK